MLKALGLFVVALAISHSATAATITCDQNENGYGSQANIEGDGAVVLESRARFECIESDGRKYSVAIDGIGIGLHAKGHSGIFIQCPAKSDVSGVYYGVQADVSVLVGASLRVVAGKSGGCLIGGLNGLAVGVNVNGIRVVIKQIDSSDEL